MLPDIDIITTDKYEEEASIHIIHRIIQREGAGEIETHIYVRREENN